MENQPLLKENQLLLKENQLKLKMQSQHQPKPRLWKLLKLLKHKMRIKMLKEFNYKLA